MYIAITMSASFSVSALAWTSRDFQKYLVTRGGTDEPTARIWRASSGHLTSVEKEEDKFLQFFARVVWPGWHPGALPDPMGSVACFSDTCSAPIWAPQPWRMWL